jgi:hypothetical protein
LGTLGQLIVSDKTRARYYSSVHLFFKWVETEGLSLPNEVHLVDELLSNYIEHLWEDGEGRSSASNVVAGLQHFKPLLRRKLICSWRLLAAWAKLELPARAPPFTESLVNFFCGVALEMKEPMFCVGLLLGFFGILRTG